MWKGPAMFFGVGWFVLALGTHNRNASWEEPEPFDRGKFLGAVYMGLMGVCFVYGVMIGTPLILGGGVMLVLTILDLIY